VEISLDGSTAAIGRLSPKAVPGHLLPFIYTQTMSE
jgi:hypothetical protein